MILEQYIGIFENALSNEACNNYIKCFEIAKAHNMTLTRAQMNDGDKIAKEDDTLFITDKWELPIHTSTHLIESAMKALALAYQEYIEEYAILSRSDPHCVSIMRLQKTSIGGGYHVWHCERAGKDSSSRVAAFMFYLNDVEEGGETEFLYQHKRFKPKAGTLLIWPTSYTHTHRGNPPLSNDKYVLTGWFQF